ncbi:hypothetical protein B9Z55_021850 [Caenorhabditis nigoni]|uniref:Uncharacterized protein n=1 Tax=Caenorhabditis nigoni TaxID=1611254 RepID=A0A2G5TTS5_9PELO|nr:hypothetical protein B9Z55_021850 [Caenorhabditis nigoni]
MADRSPVSSERGRSPSPARDRSPDHSQRGRSPSPDAFASSDEENRRPLPEDEEGEDREKKKKVKKQKRERNVEDQSAHPASKRMHTPAEDSGPLEVEHFETVQDQVNEMVDFVARQQAQDLTILLNTLTDIVKEQRAQISGLIEEIKLLTADNKSMRSTSNKTLEALQKIVQTNTAIQGNLSSKLLNGSKGSFSEQLSELIKLNQSHRAELSGTKASMKTIEGRLPSATARILANVDRQASSTEEFSRAQAESTVECRLCGGKHDTVRCRSFRKPADRVRQAGSKSICTACAEFYEPDDPLHLGCKGKSVRCGRCMEANLPVTSVNHLELFCLLNSPSGNSKGRGSSGRGRGSFKGQQ